MKTSFKILILLTTLTGHLRPAMAQSFECLSAGGYYAGIAGETRHKEFIITAHNGFGLELSRQMGIAADHEFHALTIHMPTGACKVSPHVLECRSSTARVRGTNGHEESLSLRTTAVLYLQVLKTNGHESHLVTLSIGEAEASVHFGGELYPGTLGHCAFLSMNQKMSPTYVK
jgi:hypothetical protein